MTSPAWKRILESVEMSPLPTPPPTQKLPPLESGDADPNIRLDVHPSPQLERYLSEGWEIVPPGPPRPPSPKDKEPPRL